MKSSLQCGVKDRKVVLRNRGQLDGYFEMIKLERASTKLCLALAVFLYPLAVGFADDEGWTLSRSLDYVRSNAPDAKVARLRFEKARAQLDEARTQWLPKLTAETGYSATDNPTQAFMFLLNQRQLTFGGDFNDPDVTDNWGSELRLEYPIYTGGARTAGVKAADAGVSAAEFDLATVRRQLQLEVARSYYQLLRSREMVVAAQASLESHRANLKLAQKLADAGKALATAVLDLETRVAQAEAGVVATKNQGEIATAMLKTLIGYDGKGFSVAHGWTSLKYPSDIIGASRPELSALKDRADQADAGVDIAKADRKPTIAAFASTRHDEGFTRSDGGNSWIAGVMIRLKITGRRETNAKIEQAQADRAIVDEQIRKQKQQIKFQVKSARLNLETSQKQISLARKGMKSAKKSLDLTRSRFEEGLALSTQLIDAESALTGARVRLSGARAEEQIAVASLRHALGLPINNSK